MLTDPETFEVHRERLARLVAVVHHYAAAIFILSFCGYGLAAWAWFEGATVAALVIATLSYLFFRQFHTFSFGLARNKLRGEDGFDETIALIEAAMQGQKLRDVLSGIEARLRAPDGS